MDTNFIDAVRSNFEDLVIDANAASVQRAEFGFVNKDCDFILGKEQENTLLTLF